MNITDIARQLDEARADNALLARLQNAPKRIAELEKAHAAAQAQHEKDAAKKADAEREASFDGITDIRVSETVNPNAPDNLLSAAFDITYTRPAYDMYTRQSVPKEHLVRGFGSLPHGAYLFLIGKRPDQIPAKIMALCPDDAHAAFSLYHAAKRRGHL